MTRKRAVVDWEGTPVEALFQHGKPDEFERALAMASMVRTALEQAWREGEQERRSATEYYPARLTAELGLDYRWQQVSIESAAKRSIISVMQQTPGDQEPPDQLETVTAMLKLVDRKRTKMIDYVQFSRALP